MQVFYSKSLRISFFLTNFAPQNAELGYMSSETFTYQLSKLGKLILTTILILLFIMEHWQIKWYLHTFIQIRNGKACLLCRSIKMLNKIK